MSIRSTRPERASRSVRTATPRSTPTGRVAGWVHTEESLARHVARAEDTADDIESAAGGLAGGGDPDALFPPRPGRQCGWCDYRRHCPEGRAAAPERAPWSGLAEEAPAAGTQQAPAAPAG